MSVFPHDIVEFSNIGTSLRNNIFAYFDIANRALEHLKKEDCTINTTSVRLDGPQQISLIIPLQKEQLQVLQGR